MAWGWGVGGKGEKLGVDAGRGEEVDGGSVADYEAFAFPSGGGGGGGGRGNILFFFDQIEAKWWREVTVL